MAPADLPPRPADTKHVKWIFNSPPGWPTPPTGWEPEPGWQPDPSWPPAPAYWNFWKPAGDSGKPRVSRLVKAMAGVLTFAATIAGAYFAYLAIRPHPVTTASWVDQANAACDQDYGSVQQSLFNAVAMVKAGSSSANDVSALDSAVGSLRKLIGDLSAQQMPTDSRKSQVQAALSSGDALVSSLESFSFAEQNAALNTSGTTQSQDQATESAAAKQTLINLVAWRKAIGTLGLTRCPFWTSNPDAPIPQSTTPASPPGISAGQMAQDASGGTDENETVTNATCYQNTLQQEADGTAQAQCDLTLSNGAIMRSRVTDNDNQTKFYDEFQENLTASDIANAVIGESTTDGLTVSDASCDPNTIQLDNNGSTQAHCYLTFSDGSTADQTVYYNGLSDASF